MTSAQSPKRRLILLGAGTAVAVATLGLAAPSFADTLTPQSSVSSTVAHTASTHKAKKKHHHKKKHHKKSTSTTSTQG